MGIFERDYQVQDARTVSAFSTRVYAWMAIGLGVTASVSYFLFKSGLYASLMPFWWVFSFALLGIGMSINVAIKKLPLGGVVGLFLSYAAIEGLLFGTILPLFAAAFGGQLIWTAFLTAGAIFGVAVGYGIFTKNDLTSMGRILSLALVGLISVTLLYFVLSFFMQVQWMHLLISYLGLGIFVALTAYDAQTIRRFSMQADINSVASYKLSMIMALKMYVNVVMIFWYLLQILSSNRK